VSTSARKDPGAPERFLLLLICVSVTRAPSPTRTPPGRTRIVTFHLLRLEDESGVSGTGWVAEGAVFSNGWVILVWPTGTPSMNFYESLEAVEAVHGHGGLTRIVFD